MFQNLCFGDALEKTTYSATADGEVGEAEKGGEQERQRECSKGDEQGAAVVSRCSEQGMPNGAEGEEDRYEKGQESRRAE